jgi:hypothetical protein
MLLKIKNILKKNFPKSYKIYRVLKGTDNNYKFSGWGMTTETNPPWYNNNKNKTFDEFNETLLELSRLIHKNEFILTQFSDHDIDKVLNELKWRHYVVHYTASLAFSQTVNRNIVECGTCDGLTIFFAINKLKKDKSFKAFLYDAWDEMKEEYLTTPREKKNKGNYAYLDIEVTKKNLKNFRDNIIFNQGYIPEIFSKGTNPDKICWLHIDLNSSKPTKESLDFFYPLLEVGGVILFDDYSWSGFVDTRKVIDDFFLDKKGEFFHVPTGQSFFIKQK